MRVDYSLSQNVFRSPEKEIVNEGSLRVALTDAATKTGESINSVQKGMPAVKTIVANESQARSKISSMATKLVKMSKTQAPTSPEEAKRLAEESSKNFPGYTSSNRLSSVMGLFLDEIV